MKTLSKRHISEELKKRFLMCFSVRTTNTSRLRQTVKDLVNHGITRKTLVAWAVRAGFSKGYVSSLISRILCSMGLRANRVGAGRKPSADALELLVYAQERYGKRVLNVLRAAWRSGKAQTAREGPQTEIVVPQIPNQRRIVVPQILPQGKAWNGTNADSRKERIRSKPKNAGDAAVIISIKGGTVRGYSRKEQSDEISKIDRGAVIGDCAQPHG